MVATDGTNILAIVPKSGGMTRRNGSGMRWKWKRRVLGRVAQKSVVFVCSSFHPRSPVCPFSRTLATTAHRLGQQKGLIPGRTLKTRRQRPCADFIAKIRFTQDFNVEKCLRRSTMWRWKEPSPTHRLHLSGRGARPRLLAPEGSLLGRATRHVTSQSQHSHA